MNSQSPSPKNSDERATRIYNPNELPDPEQLRVTRLEAVSKCPECGYHLLAEYSSCPYCGTQIRNHGSNKKDSPISATCPPCSSPVIISCPTCHKEISADLANCPYCGERVSLQTVRVVRRRPNAEEPKCTLTLIADDGESIETMIREFNGPTVALNRFNTEPGNTTITSRVQAVLSCENGRWFIENKSDLGSTFIQVNHRMELLPGDLIMLGDRCFQFGVIDSNKNESS